MTVGDTESWRRRYPTGRGTVAMATVAFTRALRLMETGVNDDRRGNYRGAFLAFREAAQIVVKEVLPSLEAARKAGQVTPDQHARMYAKFAGAADLYLKNAASAKEKLEAQRSAADKARADTATSGPGTSDRVRAPSAPDALAKELQDERRSAEVLRRQVAALQEELGRRTYPGGHPPMFRSSSLQLQQVDASGGVTASLPASMCSEAGIGVEDYRDIAMGFETAAGIASWTAERPVIPGEAVDAEEGTADGFGRSVRRGFRQVVLYRLPLRDDASVSSFEGHLERLARLLEKGAPSLCAVRQVHFVESSLPTSERCRTAVVEVHAPVDAITLDEWLSPPSKGGAGGAGGAGGSGAAGDDGDSAELPACGKPVWMVKQLFLQLSNVLQLLHSANLPGCLHRRSIRVSTAADESMRLSVVVLPVDCGDGSVPELPASDAAPPPIRGVESGSAASDVYLLGSWLFEALFGRQPVLLPGEPAVKVPSEIPGAVGMTAVRFGDLMSRILLRDPAGRLSSFQITVHPAMTVSVVADMKSESVILKTEAKVKALNEALAAMRDDDSRRVSLRVRRSFLVETAALAIVRLPKAHLRRKLSVQFEGEAGVDAGGLTSELYEQFFVALFDESCSLFEGQREDVANPLFLPRGPPEGSSRLPDETARTYEGVGRMLAKVLFDGRSVPARFAPSLYKYMLDLPPNLHDLDTFDPRKGKFCRELMQYAPMDVEALMFDFEDVGGSADEELSVTNRTDYVNRMIPWELVGKREESLSAMKKGFDAVGISATLRLFTATELMSLVMGQQNVSPQDVVKRLKFEEYPRGSKLPGHFKAAVKALSRDDIKRFLVYVTAQSVMPPPGTKIVIRRSLRTGALFTSHTCFNRLDVPDLSNAAVVRRRLALCLANLENAGFGEA